MQLRPVYRLTVFVPTESLKGLQQSLADSGLIRYGRYADVMWASAPGSEQFRPLAGANPTQGTSNQLTETSSCQVIFSIERDEELLFQTLEVIRANHPWEEPAIYIDESGAVEVMTTG